jgi:putative phosphoesterase
MRAAVISDIHIDEQMDEGEFEDCFALCVNKSNVDYLLIAGDVSEYYMRTLAFIKRLKEKVFAKLYFCPGNHDLWSKYEPQLSVENVVDYMRGKKGDPNFLQNDAVFLSDQTVLIAGCGWYDYSFAYEGKFTEEHLAQKHYMGRWWKDGLYAKHGISDRQVNEKWNEDLIMLVDKYSGYDIIFMTHMVNHPAFLVGEDHEKYEMFQYFNGFMGSEGLYKITKMPSIKYAISGHVHYRKSFSEGGVYYMCRCLGYPKEYPAFGGAENLESQIMSAMEIIEMR